MGSNISRMIESLVQERAQEINKSRMAAANNDFNANEYSQIILELINLRSNPENVDAFMDKLYDALTGKFSGVLNDNSPITYKSQAIWTMIDHFKAREEYMKCATLKKMADELNIVNPAEVNASK